MQPGFLTDLVLMAQEGGKNPPGGGGGGGMFGGMLLPFLAIGLLFYFLLLRPQRQEQARRKQMLTMIKKNDRVITAGGVFGVVTNVNSDADEVTVKVDESTNTKLRMTLSSIARVLGSESDDSSK